MRIWGLCPKCRTWFRADEWFDPTVPLPTCFACGMSPERVRYDFDLVSSHTAEARTRTATGLD
jgi:Zn ribbon nucleic-acid-binding protein